MDASSSSRVRVRTTRAWCGIARSVCSHGLRPSLVGHGNAIHWSSSTWDRSYYRPPRHPTESWGVPYWRLLQAVAWGPRRTVLLAPSCPSFPTALLSTYAKSLCTRYCRALSIFPLGYSISHLFDLLLGLPGHRCRPSPAPCLLHHRIASEPRGRVPHQRTRYILFFCLTSLNTATVHLGGLANFPFVTA